MCAKTHPRAVIVAFIDVTLCPPFTTLFTTTRLVVLTSPPVSRSSESSIASVPCNAVAVCAKRVLPNCILRGEVTGFSAPLIKCAFFVDTVSLFGTDVGSGDWQRIQDEIHDGTFFSSSRPLPARSLVFSPPLIFCIENLRTKWSRGESDR